MKRHLPDSAATEALASDLLAVLPADTAGWTLLLEGELGAGKTCLVGQQAADVVVVYVLGFIHARGIHEEFVLGAQNRMPEFAHVGIHPGAAAAVAEAKQVGVTIPELLRVYPFPGGGDEIVIGEFVR